MSFVVPCHDEEANVAATVAEIRAAAEAPGAAYEIILVDDHSGDRTGEIMEELAARDPRVRVIHNEVNLGYGGAYKRGATAARLEHVMLIPGDNGFPSSSIRAILRHVGEADIVIPHPANSGVRSPLRRLLSRGFTRTMNWLFDLDVGYYNSAVVHRAALLGSVTVTTDGFAFQAEVLVKLLARGCTYVECAIVIQERVAGRSAALRP